MGLTVGGSQIGAPGYVLGPFETITEDSGREAYQDLSPAVDIIRPVTCVEITPRMRWLLETLKDYPLTVDQLDRLRLIPEWADARSWGWLIESGELSGTGLRHAGQSRRGIVTQGLQIDRSLG